MMSDLTERILERLAVVRLTANAASVQATGSQSTIQNILNGRSQNPRVDTLEKLAKVLQCRVEWLVAGEGSPDPETEPQRAREVRPAEVRAPGRNDTLRDIPVMGTAAGSALGKGSFQLVPEVVEYVGRPRGLVSAMNVYALYVEGDSMSPKYEPGDLVFVNPNRKPRPGDDIIVQEPDTNNGDAQAFIKRLLAITPSLIRTKQFNPEARLDFVIRPGLIIHRVVPINELYGI